MHSHERELGVVLVMRFVRISLLYCFTLLVWGAWGGHGVLAAGFALPPGYPERVLGSADAPVTLYEYSSLTCPHCADFHRQTLPKLKASHIDTGKVRLVLRDYPLDRLSMVGAMMARCAPEAHYYKIMELLFSSQQAMVSAENPLAFLKQTGRLAGMSEADLDACFANESLLASIQQVQERARETFDVRSTPSFVIDRALYTGALSYEALSEALDRALVQKGVSR